jgi:hypothetical protein
MPCRSRSRSADRRVGEKRRSIRRRGPRANVSYRSKYTLAWPVKFRRAPWVGDIRRTFRQLSSSLKRSSVLLAIPNRTAVSGRSKLRWPPLLVSWNPFSNCRLPQGTTILELDLRPVCGNRACRIGAASLGLRLERENPRHDGKEQCPSVAWHAEDSNGRPISQVSNAARRLRVNNVNAAYDLASGREGHSGQFTLRLAKAIANMAFRQDVGWACGIVFDLFSKLADKDAQIFAFVTIF